MTFDIYIDYLYHLNQGPDAHMAMRRPETGRQVAMRQSKEVAAQTRERILKTASRAYRRRGIAGIGLAELMAEAGLTHGGFYKHFPSKDALAAEAIAHALDETRRTLERAVAAAAPGARLAALIDSYLTPVHRDRPDRGCALAALGTEAAHGAPSVRAALADGFARLAGLAAEQMADAALPLREAKGQALVSALVGTLMLSRTLPDRGQSDAMLTRSRDTLLAAFGGEGGAAASVPGAPASG